MLASPAVGVDVGGPRKGFHAVAIRDARIIGKFASRDAGEVAAWCRATGAAAIAIDAPCKWSADGGARPAERELMRAGIQCFASTTRAKALAHPKRYFHWMLNGEALFHALAESHPLFSPALTGPGDPFCCETFPQAVACSLAGKIVSAKEKRTFRRDIMRRSGIDPAPLRNIDEIDAAICALAARAAATGAFRAFGEAPSGFIVVPSRALLAT